MIPLITVGLLPLRRLGMPRIPIDRKSLNAYPHRTPSILPPIRIEFPA